ncbi:hypothetical protein A374_01134 [Fictibacillus macauensis ZFHKF-1]|uniref:Uncharacterized protein n=1 Tax=Fictibacillus macauensis ZFHKF-1 TaxID=1196324 RepID=I8AN90_9BACL|nr:hypothetical protein [Fictibacillus macauensis]EIT87244.1 hypothetical protein A374_01134 [Fictibacillus macauensis ZFHKF-1]
MKRMKYAVAFMCLLLFAVTGDVYAVGTKEEVKHNAPLLSYEQAVNRAAALTGEKVATIKKKHPNNHRTSCYWMELSTKLKGTSASVVLLPQVCKKGDVLSIQTTRDPLALTITGNKAFEGTVAVDLEPSGYYFVVNGNFYQEANVMKHHVKKVQKGHYKATLLVSPRAQYASSYYSGLHYKRIIQ